MSASALLPPSDEACNRFLDALFHTVDGNFHQKQKRKPMDEEDLPLTLGSAYYVNEVGFARFQASLKPIAKEVRAPLIVYRSC